MGTERATSMRESHAGRRGFTLIELLVVIAIIAILAAAIRPSVNAANDRANTAICQARLEQINLALRQYVEDHGRMPDSLGALTRERYLLDEEVLRCARSGRSYFYHAVAPDGDPAQVIAGCVSPLTPAGKRPHGQGTAAVMLRLSGKVAIAR